MSDSTQTTQTSAPADQIATSQEPTQAVQASSPGPSDSPAQGSADGAQAPTTAESGSEPKPASQQAPAWVRQRIDELTAKYRTAETLAQQREREVAELRAQLQLQGVETPTQGFAPQPGTAPLDLDAQVTARAAQMQFNKDCDAVALKGQEAFKDFPDVMKNYAMLGGLTIPFLEAVLAEDEPHKVLYELGKDPTTAQKLLQMSPARMGVALAKFSSKLAAPVQVSKAPEPIPGRVGSAGKSPEVRLEDESVSMKDWIAKRNAQLREARKTG